MAFLRSLYLTDRIFYALGVCVALLFCAYLMEPVFYLAILLFLGIILILIVDIFLLFRGKNVNASRQVNAVLSLNDQNKILLHVSNLKPFSLKLKIIDEIPHQFNLRDFVVNTTLNKAQGEELYYTIAPKLRGEYVFGNLQIFVKTSLGLIARRETTNCEKIVAVYPSVIQMYRQQLIALKHPSFVQGENKNRLPGRSYEFDQIKVYVPGDDTRHINWKATSTTNEVMVNCYEDERSQQIYSIIDKSRVMKTPFNGLTLVDYAINSTLAFSNIVLKKQDKAGLIVFSKGIGSYLKADKGPRHLKKIMYGLYKEKYDYSEASYESLYASVKREIPNRSLLFLYTNFDSIYALERNIPILKLINTSHLLVVVFFENSELQTYSRQEASDLQDIYQLTIAKKFILEKNQIYKELQKHGIHAIQTSPENLYSATINKYLEFKTKGMI
ncbi:MAG: DUF58 domain-containing protein [Bacteroidia bacterium]|nr:DUF58 domain-containing protein [Bacteroidia bacterium]